MDTVAKLFKSNFNFVIGVFDARRGTVEGDEQDKILGFYPPAVSTNVKNSIIGLCQAVITFASTFSKDGGCEVMEAENNRWVMHECEPDIWMLLVVNKAWISTSCCSTMLKNFLMVCHSTFVLLNGSLQALLDQDETAYKVRRKLHSYLWDVSLNIQKGELREPWLPTSALSISQGVPFLPVSRKLFLGVQSLASNLQIMNVYGSRVVAGVMVMVDQYLIWSTLTKGDTFSLHCFTQRSILPAVKAATASIWKLQSAPEVKMLSTCSTEWTLLPSGFMVPQHQMQSANPLPPNTAAAAVGPQPSSLRPLRVWLQGGSEQCALQPFYKDKLLILLVLHDVVQLSQDTTTALTETLLPKVKQLTPLLAQEPMPHNMWHVPGFRYSFMDPVSLAAKASPLNKVSTLAAQSLAALADLADRAELEWRVRQDKPDDDMDVVVRAQHDCWAVVRQSGPRRLYLVIERDHDSNFLTVSSNIQRFCDEHFPGVFEA